LKEDVDLSPEREQAAVTVCTVLVKYAGQWHKNRIHDAAQFELSVD